jgi:peptide/nickel transport system permease protein
MTDAAGSGAAAAAPAAGRDSWDAVLAQAFARRSTRVAAGALLLLYGVAVYAPLLAGDRPLYLFGTDAAAYGRALRLLPAATRDLQVLVDGDAAAVAAAVGRQAAVERQLDAVLQRLDVLRRQLAPAEHAPLDRLEALARRSASLAESSPAEARAVVAEAVEAAQAARTALNPAEAGAPPEPGRSVALQPFRRWPALEAVSRVELWFMGVWALLLTFPLWNRALDTWRRNRGRRSAGRVRGRKLLAVLLLPLLPCAAFSPGSGPRLLQDPWEWATGSESPHAASAYKEGLTTGAIRAEGLLMPPVAFGVAEIHDGEYFRPPTWHASAAISAEGRYERGARSLDADGPHDFQAAPRPVEVRAGEPARNAALRHPLGTDGLGRDLLSRMVWGGRVSLSVGLVSTVFLVLIGVVVGALAGYCGGWVDLLLSRVIEVFQCFPPFFLVLIVVAFVGPGILNVMLVLGLTRWPGVARLVRGEFLRLRSQDFVVAAEALGARRRRTIFRHILPNALGPVLVAASFSVASGILTESALSFLGLGVKLPVPSWGSLLTESRSPEHWWIQVFPGLMIFVTVVLYNLLGEAVRDALDPRMKA